MAGGLGGLGGYLNSPSGGNMLQALGYSLMSSPRNAPLQNFGQFHAELQGQQMKRDILDQERADLMAGREAMAAALVSAGVPPEEAATLSINPQAAEVRLSQIQREREQAADEGFLSRMPGYGGTAADTSGGSSGGLGGLGGSAVIDGNNIPDIEAAPDRPQIAQGYGGASVFSERGAAQTNLNQFNPGGAIADKDYLEATPAPGPGAEIPLAKPAGNKSVAWLQENDPEVAAMVDQGVISPKDGFDIAMQRQQGQRAYDQRAQTSQAELDGLYQKREAIARWLTEAPSEKAYNKGKRHLDIYDAQIARLEKQRKATADTDTMRNLQWRAEQAGLQPGTPEYQNFMMTGGRSDGVTVNVGDGAPGLGKLSPDFGYVLDPNTREPVIDPITGLPQAAPVPGSPAWIDAEKARAANEMATENQSSSGDVILNAARRAREALNARGLPATGTVGKLLSGIPESNAAEVRRQVEVLKSNAKIENLQAMRKASPTGGALGAVSDKENEMLADKAGALDPNSPTFARDLDDYERTLLRIIHGKTVGDAIFEDTRSSGRDVRQERQSPSGGTDYTTKYGLE